MMGVFMMGVFMMGAFMMDALYGCRKGRMLGSKGACSYECTHELAIVSCHLR